MERRWRLKEFVMVGSARLVLSSLLSVMSSIFFSSKLLKLLVRLAWNPLARAAEAEETTRFLSCPPGPSRLRADRMPRGGAERGLAGLAEFALLGTDAVSVMELAGETTGSDWKLDGGRVIARGLFPQEELVGKVEV